MSLHCYIFQLLLPRTIEGDHTHPCADADQRILGTQSDADCTANNEQVVAQGKEVHIFPRSVDKRSRRRAQNLVPCGFHGYAANSGFALSYANRRWTTNAFISQSPSTPIGQRLPSNALATTSSAISRISVSPHP
jgi:hypothetical protein